MHTHKATVGILALLLALAIASLAQAQGREFAGTVASISGSQIVVEDRRGERVSFARSKDTVVEGKGGWGAIQKGARVIVQWGISDGPRQARRVIVLGAGS